MAEGMILNAAFFFSLAAAAAGAAAYVFRRPQFAKAAPPAMALSWLALSAGLLLLWLRLRLLTPRCALLQLKINIPHQCAVAELS